MSTDDVNALLDAMQARCDAATEGPWEAIEDDSIHAAPAYVDNGGCGVIAWRPVCDFVVRHGDAEFIAAARQDQPRLIAAVRAVLDEHPRYEGDFSDFCGHCQARGEGTWPCPTVTAIHAALIGDGDE